MGDFFHCWRRNAGCGLLVMAMLFVDAWIRSFHQRDSISFRMLGFWNEIESWDHHLVWNVEVHSLIFQRAWRVHYRSLAMPLTLLSAYLLLWKPRKTVKSPTASCSN